MAEIVDIPQGYKKTKLGIIPDSWKVQRLEDTCSHFKSGIGITSKNIFETGDIPVYGGNGLRGYTNRYSHEGEYVLIGRQGALCGNIQFVKGKSYISEHAIAVQANEQNVLAYLRYKLEQERLNRYSESSAQPGLSVAKLLKLKVALPPLPEQQKIAEILSTWDQAISTTQKLIDELKLRNKGLAQQLLTGKKRLKGFDRNWKKHHYSGILKKVKRPLKWDDEALYNLISVRRRSGGIFYRDALYGHQIKVKNLNTAKTGDFLFSKMQIVHGASALVTPEFDGAKISGSYISVRAKDESTLSMDFFNWYSKLPRFYHQTFISSYGVHIEKMTFDFELFLTETIHLPSIQGQQAIVSVLNEADKELQLHQEQLDTLKEQKKGLMQKLLTGEVRTI
jgi:type I restriction enzyme S subunit